MDYNKKLGSSNKKHPNTKFKTKVDVEDGESKYNSCPRCDSKNVTKHGEEVGCKVYNCDNCGSIWF